MKIMFVCLGNICRSAMAEFMMKDALKKRGISDKYVIDSAATCGLEAGNPVYPDALKKLKEHDVPTYPHYSKQVRKTDYDKYDLFWEWTIKTSHISKIFSRPTKKRR